MHAEKPISFPSSSIYVIIPAYNEEDAIAKVINDIPSDWVTEVIVVNNGSVDRTKAVAAAAGATVVDEPNMGYGNACLKGLSYLLAKLQKDDVIVFLDGDYSDYPEALPQLVTPILANTADFVLGSRVLGKREAKSLMPQQMFGNWLATSLIRWLYGVKYTDLGPFRAIRYESLRILNMKDQTYGWTVEMQLKAARHKLRIQEIPVDYRVRIGHSKVSGTVKGTILAGYKILGWIFKFWLTR
jgi:glycosyltransferase involved in cell wall biosynthesis